MLKIGNADMKPGRHAVLLMAALLGLTDEAYAEGRSIEFSGGMDYSVGDYGQTADTTVVYIPASVKVRSNHWAYGLTVPYVSITGPDTSIVTPDGITTTGNASGTRTDSGIGDIVLSAQYGFEPISPLGTYFDLTGKVKFATADVDKGLGTGTNSYTVLLDVYQPTEVVDVFAAAGYRINSSSADFQLNNVWLASAGVARRLTDILHGGISYDYRAAASARSTSSKEITPYISWKLTPQWKVKGYATLGLSKQSPDIAGGIQVGYSTRVGVRPYI